MKYTIELESPDFHVLIDAARREIVASAAVHREMQRLWGRGHALAVTAGQREVAAARCLKALTLASEAAEPERATGSTENTSLPTGEEMPAGMVYGRPRGVARRKPSNLKRKYVRG